jgi:hypothetical protein
MFKPLTLWVLLVAVAAAMSGCHRKKAGPSGPDLRLKLSEAIQKRFREPYTAPPGTTIASLVAKDKGSTEIHPQGGIGGTRTPGASSESGDMVAGFVLDLRGLNPKVFAENITSICGTRDFPLPENVGAMQGWEEFAAWAKNGDGTNRLAYWISMFYADRFSGLGLSRSGCSLARAKQEEGYTVVLGNSDRSNLIFITTWVSLPQSKAYTNIAYAAHWGNEHIGSWGTPGSWGTRPLEEPHR